MTIARTTHRFGMASLDVKTGREEEPRALPEARRRALRSHDFTHGLQNVDSRSAAVAPLRATKVIGWSAALAGNLREQEVEDLDALRAVAAQTLGIEAFAFDHVLRTIEETELGTVQHRRGGRDVLYVSDVGYADLYDRLGEHWASSKPSELDSAMVGVLDAVALAPRRESALKKALGLDQDTQDLVLRLGERTQLLKSVVDDSGERFIYTPFYSFENTEVLVQVLEHTKDDEVRAAFDAVREYQGLTVDERHPVLQAAVSAGLIAAPTIEGVSGPRSFAILPFAVPPELRVIKKTVLEKAQAILAAVRYGQNHGRNFRIGRPGAVLYSLVSRKRLNPHSEHGQQYFALAKMHIVRLVPSGNWYGVELIDTQDNNEAVRIALDLLRYGELVEERSTDRRDDVRALVESSKDYKHPIYTIDQQRPTVPLPDRIVRRMLESIQGGSPVV